MVRLTVLFVINILGKAAIIMCLVNIPVNFSVICKGYFCLEMNIIFKFSLFNLLIRVGNLEITIALLYIV